MNYMRGSQYDYDEWAANGNTGWSYKDLLPYFKKSERQTNQEYARNGDCEFVIVNQSIM